VAELISGGDVGHQWTSNSLSRITSVGGTTLSAW